MATIRVLHQDGSEDTLPHVSHAIEEQFEKLWNATIKTSRAAAKDVTFEEADDYVFVESAQGLEFGGVLRSVDTGDKTTTLIADSFEQLALDAEPTDSGTRWQGVADSTIIQDAIDAIPQLEAGTVQTIKNGLTFIFSHSTQAKKMRTVADSTGGRLRFNPDLTVDYVARLGEDRDEVLTPKDQSIVDSLTVNRKGGEDRRTHLRMLAVGEGRHQRAVDVISDDFDPNTDREKWRVIPNKDITDEGTLTEHGNELIDELADEWVEAKGTLRNLDDPPTLGDTFVVEHPESGLQKRLGVVRIVRKLDGSNGRRWECEFSSRILTRQKQAQKTRKDVGRYNKAFEGTPVMMTSGGGRQPVNSQRNYEFSFYYPAEVEYEHRVGLRIIGLPYRAYSQGAASGGTTLTDSNTDPSSVEATNITGGSFTSTSSWQTIETIQQGSAVTEETVIMVGMAYNPLNDSERVTGQVRIEDSDGNHYPSSDGTANFVEVSGGEGDGGFNATFIVPGNNANETFDIQHLGAGGESYTYGVNYMAKSQHEHNLDPHAHDVEPGILEFDTYPSNCDVLVNGVSQNVSLGDGNDRFEEVVDLRGELVPGQYNTVEVTTSLLGHIQANLDIDVYRQILGDG
jgi:hypothetical protein